MPWTIDSNVEVGYMIPCVYVSPPIHREDITQLNRTIYAIFTIELNLARWTNSDVNSLTQGPSDLVGQLRYNNQVSVGILRDNVPVLLEETELVSLTMTPETKLYTFKIPLRNLAGETQLVLYNAGTTNVININSYEIMLDRAGNQRRLSR